MTTIKITPLEPTGPLRIRVWSKGSIRIPYKEPKGWVLVLPPRYFDVGTLTEFNRRDVEKMYIYEGFVDIVVKWRRIYEYV